MKKRKKRKKKTGRLPWQAQCWAHSRGSTIFEEWTNTLIARSGKGFFNFWCEHCSECPFWNSVRGSCTLAMNMVTSMSLSLYDSVGTRWRVHTESAVGDHFSILLAATGGQWVGNGSVGSWMRQRVDSFAVPFLRLSETQMYLPMPQ